MSTKEGYAAPVAAYIPIPPSATVIPPPPAEGSVNPTRLSIAPDASKAPAQMDRLPSFPPSTSSANAGTAPGSRKFSASTGSISGISGISTNVSDLLLSSLLPPGLPKLPSSTNASSGAGTSGGAGSRDAKGHAKPRELSTVREGLRLDVMSNNFRRFVTKVGPVFWLQDRIEEVLFWRKPVWTWAWLLAWTAISFQPRLLLLAPFLTLLLILLHTNERLHPVKTLFGVRSSAPSAGTARIAAQKVFKDVSTSGTGPPAAGTGAGPKGASSEGDKGQGVSVTTGPDGEVLPAVPPKEAESGVDYFMNLQAIQNTMGWVSDAYDEVAPILASLTAPSRSPTSLPLSSTHLILMLLPPTALLPLTPGWLIPYILLPIGWGPTLVYHPHLAPLIRSLPRSRLIRRARAIVTDLLLTDALPDDVGRRTIQRVEVWENERLDPAITAKAYASASSGSAGVPPGSWSYRHLRAGERLPWVKVTVTSTVRPHHEGHARRTSLAGGAEKSADQLLLSQLVGAGSGGRSDRDDVSSNGTSAGAPSLTSSSASTASGAVSRSPWFDPHDSLPRPAAGGSAGTGAGTGGGAQEDEGGSAAAAALKLKAGWRWVPGEEWMVDMSAEWCDLGADDEGWVYSDDSWQSPAPMPMVDADTSGPMPALRRPTRRRKWWRRVYYVPPEESA